MEIKDLQKLTLLDYPGKVSCTLFLFGCNFRCPFCFNASLVIEDETPTISEKDLMKFLEERKDWFDGVCISGGEPTLQERLPQFIRKVRKFGFAIKLDTNGSNPEMLKRLVKDDLIDYIAMDLKAPFQKYREVVKAKVEIEKIKESLEFVKGHIDHEIRTTVVPTIHSEKDIVKIARQAKGAKKYYLQQFKPKNTLDPSFMDLSPLSSEELDDIRKSCSKYLPIYLRA